MCRDLDLLGIFPEQYCQDREDFSWGSNELTDDTKERLKAMGITVRHYSSLGKGCMVRFSSEDFLTLKLAFDGFDGFLELGHVLDT
jgi:hypothetical protein